VGRAVTAPQEDPAALRPGARPMQVLVLDHEFAVESTSEQLLGFDRWPALGGQGRTVPPKVLEFIRGEVERYRAAGNHGGSTLIFPDLLVHIVDLQGPGGTKVVAAFTAFAVRDPIRQASERFNLTERERQVLALLLRGMRATQIANALELSELTIGDYFKRLRRKTGARTQSGMIARLLGWTVVPGDVEHSG
jgi:DNA-binding CsgD family transcriptional regulator